MEWDDGEIQHNISELDHRTKKAIELAFAFQAARSTGYMKTTAPWTDQTGAARAARAKGENVPETGGFVTPGGCRS